MLPLRIEQGIFRLSDIRTLFIPELQILPSEAWAFVGGNGSGKSALAKVLSQEGILLKGYCHSPFLRPVRLSPEQLHQLNQDEWQRNNTDLLAPEEIDNGRTVTEIIQWEVKQNSVCMKWAQLFGIGHLLNRRFKYLSTGETRKAMLCQVLMQQPDLLILDEPFAGLDKDSRDQFARCLQQLHLEGVTIVMMLSRFDELPDFVHQVGLLAECQLHCTGPRQSMFNNPAIQQLTQCETVANIILPEADHPAFPLPKDQALVALRNGRVHYQDNTVFSGLNWQVMPGEHWQITGPNGAGKSTLLSLVTGDHPQGYANDLTLFGRRRGSGETIWEIKQHIGYVSSALHLEYRVSLSVRGVILSGFFDTIGVYQAASERQLALTQQWLTLLGFSAQQADAPFKSLSWGQQRLVLIVRALVKHPPLLILDEPLQGLDPLNRIGVKQWIDILIQKGQTQLLFVSHHVEDAPTCITHRLSFIPEQTGYRISQQILRKGEPHDTN